MIKRSSIRGEVGGIVLLVAFIFLLGVCAAFVWVSIKATDLGLGFENESTFVRAMIHLQVEYDGKASQLDARGKETPAFRLAVRPEFNQVLDRLNVPFGRIDGLVTEPGRDTRPLTLVRNAVGNWRTEETFQHLKGLVFNFKLKKPSPDRRHFFQILNVISGPGTINKKVEIWHRTND